MRSKTHKYIIKELDGVIYDGYSYYVRLDPNDLYKEPYDDKSLKV